MREALVFILAFVLLIVPVYAEASESLPDEIQDAGFFSHVWNWIKTGLQRLSPMYYINQIKRDASQLGRELAETAIYIGTEIAHLLSETSVSASESGSLFTDKPLNDEVWVAQGARAFDEESEDVYSLGLTQDSYNHQGNHPNRLPKEPSLGGQPPISSGVIAASSMTTASNKNSCLVDRIRTRYVGGYLVINGADVVLVNRPSSLTATPVIHVQPIATLVCNNGTKREVPHGEVETYIGTPYTITADIKTDEPGVYENVVISDLVGNVIRKFPPGTVDEYVGSNSISGTHSYRVEAFAQQLSK